VPVAAVRHAVAAASGSVLVARHSTIPGHVAAVEHIAPVVGHAAVERYEAGASENAAAGEHAFVGEYAVAIEDDVVARHSVAEHAVIAEHVTDGANHATIAGYAGVAVHPDGARHFTNAAEHAAIAEHVGPDRHAGVAEHRDAPAGHCADTGQSHAFAGHDSETILPHSPDHFQLETLNHVRHDRLHLQISTEAVLHWPGPMGYHKWRWEWRQLDDGQPGLEEHHSQSRLGHP